MGIGAIARCDRSSRAARFVEGPAGKAAAAHCVGCVWMHFHRSAIIHGQICLLQCSSAGHIRCSWGIANGTGGCGQIILQCHRSSSFGPCAVHPFTPAILLVEPAVQENFCRLEPSPPRCASEERRYYGTMG